jgi:hypothetical protein
MTDQESELDRLDPEPVSVKLSTGFPVEIVRLRTRQFFRLLRVLTHGAGPAMMQAGLNFRDDPTEFTSKFLMLVLMSIPDAETEAIAFLQSMCKPAGLSEKAESQQSKQEKEDNQARWDEFNKELFNPELGDTIDLIEAIVRQEAPELQALGKRLEGMLALFRKTGQDQEPAEPEASPEELASRGPSPSPSTSSAASTDGLTSTSSESPSAGSGRSSKRSRPAENVTT